MNYVEIPTVFSVAGDMLPGIAALPERPYDCGVLIVVGGPQYRAGSHRQFLLLSRRLAEAGYPAFRFDCRGMGDGEGPMRSFEDISEDIGAAIDAFQRQCPQLSRCILWGLCDAASAILLYLNATGDARVGGVVLLNPWVRSEAGLAQTHIKHYYGQRLLQREFWTKLVTGKMDVAASLRDFVASAGRSRLPSKCQNRQLSFRDRMAAGLRRFGGDVLLILSGRDYTAKEFIEYSRTDPAWSGLLTAGNIRKAEIPDADHTFSTAGWRADVENETLQWLARTRKTG